MPHLLKLIVRVWLRVRIAGDLHTVRSPALVVANHDAWLDCLLLGLYLPGRTCVVMPKDDLAPAWSRWFGRFFHHRVLELSEPSTVKRVVRMLSAGETV